jgi:hypothetical protein
MPEQIGIQFATAVARRDEAALLVLLDAEVDFRGMTPERFEQAHGPARLLEILLGEWLTPADEVTGIKSIDSDAVADLRRVGYRLYVVKHGRSFVVEHVAYFRVRGQRIAWLQVMSSGMLPRQV